MGTMGKTITVFGLIVVVAVCVINAAVEKPHDGLTVTINTKSLPRCNNIPTDVTARITPASLGRGRTNFNRVEHAQRMAEMQALNCDDKGHIIASSLGGVAETWNLFPQVQRLNRGKESESHETEITRANWKGLERKAKTFLESGSAAEKREVEWKVYFDYQPTRPCRPHDIQVECKFFKNGLESDNESHAYVNENHGYNNCVEPLSLMDRIF